MLRGRRLGLLSLAAALGVVAALALSTSPALPAGNATARPARLNMGVQVLRFTTAGKSLHAIGRVTASLTDQAGHTVTVNKLVTLQVASGRSCKILTLILQELNLNLLGLNVHLSKVVLTITGIPSGGVLGSLFCSLARAHLASARASAARTLSADLRHGRQYMLRFGTFVTPSATATSAGATCPVLDLILGPLHLDLLGLVVDLNQVHLTITATQGGGILGDLFCSLSTTSTSSSSTTTT